MFIYLVERTDHCDYDQYDSFVVAAETAKVARHAHPSGHKDVCGEWPVDPADLKITKIGRAVGNVRGVINSSFNAG